MKQEFIVIHRAYFGSERGDCIDVTKNAIIINPFAYGIKELSVKEAEKYILNEEDSIRHLQDAVTEHTCKIEAMKACIKKFKELQ